jgi:hypothetical protein
MSETGVWGTLPAGGQDMRALFFSALLLAGLISQATAQLAVGPVAINNNVYGVPIVISATSWTTVNSTENGVVVNARIFADLVDFQRKFSNVVSAFKLSADACANRTVDTPNPIVSLKSSSLWPRGDQLVMFIRGNVDIWSCVAGPLKSEIRWQTKKFVFIKYRAPVRHTWTNLKKNKADTQPFDASLPIYLVKKNDGAVALEFAKPYVKIEGQYSDEILKSTNAGINKNAHNAIQSVIDLAKLKAVLPGEIQKLNLSIVSARFRDYGGHAIAEINLAANIAASSTMQLPEQITASVKN